jgi:CheY-like chemotaxis protein
MKVFLSWSGEQSLAVAKALREWLPYINAEIQPWISGTDIAPGERWSGEVAQQLEAADVGIVCVTRENQLAAWLNFEAGALAKKLESSRVVPLAINLKPSEVHQPLGQFQAKEATKAGILDVLRLLNGLCTNRVPDIVRACDLWWPQFEPDLKRAAATVGEEPASDQHVLLEEIYRIVKEKLDRASEAVPAGREGERTQVARRAERIASFIQDARILLVNDVPGEMSYVVSLLKSLKLSVTITTSTERALAELDGPMFDIIISDMRRNGDDGAGLALLQSIRDSRIMTPVIFTVGRYQPERGVPGGAFGITNRVDELLNLVFDVLERTRG